MYLIFIDAHSKWIDVHITSGCTTATTIEKLQLSFSTVGYHCTAIQCPATTDTIVKCTSLLTIVDSISIYIIKTGQLASYTAATEKLVITLLNSYRWLVALQYSETDFHIELSVPFVTIQISVGVTEFTWPINACVFPLLHEPWICQQHCSYS